MQRSKVEKTYKVLIVEDIPDALDLLKSFVCTHNELFLAGIAHDGKEAIQKLFSEDYDLLLIDIDLPFLSGIEVIDELIKKKIKNIYIVFTTAYDQYAIRAFSIGAIDYLLKPFSLERFNQAIERFISRIESDINFTYSIENNNLSFKEKRKQRIIPYTEILYLSSSGKSTIIHAKNDEFEAAGLIKKIEKKLPQSIFLRIHKQYIVNITYIKGLEYDKGSHSQYLLILKDEEDTILPVGKDYVSLLKKKLSI